MMLLTVVCAGVYAALPQIMRLATPSLFSSTTQPVSFWIICERRKDKVAVLFADLCFFFRVFVLQLSLPCLPISSFAPSLWTPCRKVSRSFGFERESREDSRS